MGRFDTGRMGDKTDKTTTTASTSAASAGMTVEQIRKQSFGTVRRGYDPRQVSTYLTKVADRVATLEKRVVELESKGAPAAAKATAPIDDVDPYTGLSTHVASVMKAFDKDVDRRRKDADEKAERTVADAQAEAERIRLDAQIKAEEVRAEASASLEDFKKEAAAEVSALTQKRDAILSELRAIRERLIVSVEQLPKPQAQPSGGAPEPADAPMIVETPTVSTAPRAD
jgi:DivIVA domain-containing protein